jgi:hypothetical protein
MIQFSKEVTQSQSKSQQAEQEEASPVEPELAEQKDESQLELPHVVQKALSSFKSQLTEHDEKSQGEPRLAEQEAQSA